MSVPLPRPIKQTIKRVLWSAKGIFILEDYLKFKKSARREGRGLEASLDTLCPVLFDKTAGTNFDRHYVYHVSWAVRRVKEISPAKHIDIGSTLYFAGTLSAFIPVDFYDYRPADIQLSGLHSLRGDLLHLPFKDGEVASLSCLHTIEHVGLGRYGDPIDANGDLKAIKELCRVTAHGGNLLVVVPTGKAMRIEFNAHRVYAFEQFVSCFEGFKLKQFSYIPERAERGGLIEHASPTDIANDVHGCGCYWFTKE